MENVFLYLIKSSGLIAVFYAAYFLLLRKETFFKSNRWFLLIGLITSVVLPMVTFKKVIWIDAAPKAYEWANVPVSAALTQYPAHDIDWYLLLALVYGIGMLALLFKFFFDFKNLATVLKGQTIYQQADFKLIDVAEKVAPFSYFNYIVYNSAMYSDAELENILEHEKVHCEQKHSIDVLLSRFFCILFWYNPFIWMYQRAILQNLEFIADNEALKNISDKKAYQITLLKVTTHDHCVEITNHFYQSLIKKRIVMLNKNESKKWNSWKYFIMVPALAAFLFYFQIKVIAQERHAPVIEQHIGKQGVVAVIIDKNSTDEQLRKESELWKKEHHVKLKFSKIKRNSANEIVAIKVEFNDDKGSKGTTQFSSGEPIKPIRFYKSDDGSIGFGSAEGRQSYAFNSNNEDDQGEIVTITSEDEEVGEAAELPEAPEAPEPPEVGEPGMPATPATAPNAPLPPKAPKKIIKTVDIRKGENGKNRIRVVVNDDEVIDMDVDKVIADLEPMLRSSLDNLEDLKNIDTEEIRRVTRDAVRNARRSVRDSQTEVEQAMRAADRSKPQLENARREMEAARDEMRQAKAEMEKSKEELEQSRAELQKAKAEAKKQKK